MQVKYQAPKMTEEEACQLAHEWYGLRATAQALPSERDQNFYLQTETGQEFVLKLAQADEQRDAARTSPRP